MYDAMTIEISNTDAKSTICKNILSALPEWFGIPESTQEYIEGVANKPFYAIFDGETAVGFVSLEIHNEHTAEIYVMGVLPGYHGMGIGSILVWACEDFCCENNLSFLTVKTLADTHPDENYAKTRQFYQSVGFLPLEVFPALWGESNPCMLMGKYIHYVPPHPMRVYEKRRVYHYKDGHKVTLRNPRKIIARPSGSQRVRTRDGKMHIILPGWKHLEIEPKPRTSWVF